jgi:hypothetical protein
VEVKVKKSQEGVLLEGRLPPEIAEAEAAEIFPLRDGICLLAAKGAMERTQMGQGLSGEEKALLKKLLAIRFERRTPSEVDRALAPKERGILSVLVGKKAVSVFRSEKYPKGVYNVSDAVYGQAREGDAWAAKGAGQQQAARWGGAVARGAQADPLAKGYAVLESEGEARRLSSSIANEVKAGEVSGLRSFDRKFYFVSKGFVAQWQPKAVAALEKGGMTAEELSRKVGLEAEGCRALLLHLGEAGELLEKGKGKFALA